MARTQEEDEGRTWRAFCRKSGGLTISDARDDRILVTSQGRTRWVTDLMAGCWTCNLGHGNRSVERAKSGGYFAELMTSSHPAERELSDKLCDLLGYHRVIYATSGSSAMDLAMRIAFQATSTAPFKVRDKIVALKGAYHGSTSLCLAVAGHNEYRAWQPYDVLEKSLGDWVFDRDLIGVENAAMGDAPIHWRRVAAVVIEPVQGVGGVRVITDQAYKFLVDACRASGALLIADEVTSGMGRTNGLAFSQIFRKDYRPDVLVLGKALTNGCFPLSAVLLSEEVCDRLHKAAGSQLMLQSIWGETYGGHPVGCRVALEVLRQMTAPHFFPLLKDKAASVMSMLLESKLSKHATVRQTGMFIGLEVGANHAIRAQKRLLDHYDIRVINHGAALVIAPPLTINESLLRSSFEQIEACVEETRRAR